MEIYASPVNCARWIYNFVFMDYKCSHCGERQGKKTNYCPNCGMEMIERR